MTETIAAERPKHILYWGTRRGADEVARERRIDRRLVHPVTEGGRWMRGLRYCPELVSTGEPVSRGPRTEEAKEAWSYLDRIYGGQS